MGRVKATHWIDQIEIEVEEPQPAPQGCWLECPRCGGYVGPFTSLQDVEGLDPVTRCERCNDGKNNRQGSEE